MVNENDFRIVEFQSRMLQAQITMTGMIAENKQRVLNGKNLIYLSDDFTKLIDEYGLGYNDVPRYMGY